MVRRAPALTVFVVLLAVLAFACPGQKTPSSPAAPSAADGRKGPVAWRVSKSGLGFRISNADEDADVDTPRPVAPTTPLAPDTANKIFGRMPELKREPDDAQDFALREKSIPPPRPGKTVTDPFPPPPQPLSKPATAAAGPLKVERHAPEGAVEIAPHLTMTFSEPMIPVTSIDALTKETIPATLTPEPPGKWRWLGTKTLRFQPEKRFPMATEYSVNIAAGTKSINGQVLAEAVHWTFVTPTLTLKRTSPHGRSEPREPIVFAEFDQKIEPEALLKSIELASAKESFPIRLATAEETEMNDGARRLSQQGEPERWIAFRPVAKLPTATAITVRVKSGAPSAEGPRRTTKDQSFSFSTYGPLRVVSARCGWREKCAPLDPFAISFSNPIDPKAFDKGLVSVSPEVPGMKVEMNGQSITLSGRSKGRTKYAVTIAGKLTDTHGQTMGEDAKVTWDVGNAEPVLFGGESEMIILDPSAPREYPVYSINEPALHARIYAVGPDDWEKYLAYLRELERPRKLRTPGRLVFDKVIATKKAPDELVETRLALGPALTGRFGHALVVVESTRTIPKDQRRPEFQIWIQSTDLAVNAFVESDQLTGWITQLADGTAINGADLQLLATGATAKTDATGIARVALADKAGRLLVARKDRDVAIAPEGRWTDGAYARQASTDSVRWLVFDDRGMYKPGEEVRFKGWVRKYGTGKEGDIGAIPDIAGKTVSYRIRDPRWAEIGKGTTTVDANGGFDFAYTLPGNANLGDARVEFELQGVGLNGTSADHSFQVQEFRRPEFEVTTKVSEGPHFVGEHAIATVAATYYAGGGLPDAPVHWTITGTTSSFTPPNRSDFHFGPARSFEFGRFFGGKPEETKSETWNAKTNAQGVHRLRFDFDAIEPSYPLHLSMATNVEDVNRQSWAGRATMLVHPADDYVGIKLGRNFVRAGEAIDAEFVVTDVEGKPAVGKRVAVKSARLEWEQKGIEYEEKEVDVQTCAFESPAPRPGKETSKCSLKTTQGGRYRLTAIVTDASGRKNQSTEMVWVLGDTSPKDRSLNGDRAQVILDKKDYKPGDDAEILVVSPFAPAEGVLTLRRDGIVRLERFSMKSATATLRVKLPDAYVPNVIAQVDLAGADVRTGANGELGASLPERPAFAQGTANVKVRPTTRTLGVKATARKPTLEPGGQTQIDLEVNDPAGKGVANAQIAVIVADEAVLALSGYKTPDPISVFYSERGDGVQDVAIRNRVQLAANLASRSTSNVGAEVMMDGVVASKAGAGRPMALPSAAAPPPAAPKPEQARANKERNAEADFDAPEAKKSQLDTGSSTPIALRSNFAARALFAPKVSTDASGHATVPLKLPDNLTRYRIMAVAATTDRMFGANESTVTARLPLMVRPSAPRFLNFGDRFEFPIVVQNQTDSPIDTGIVIRATNATVENSAKRVTIPANDRVEVRFPSGTIKPGTARFQIGIAAGNWSDASEIAIPVWTPATTEAFATYGEIDQGAIAQPVSMPPGVFTQFGGLEVETSSTQLQALTDAVLYLVKYPFECNEQIASRVLAIASLKDVLSAFHAKGLPSSEAMLASMTTDFEKLARHQNGNGGWGFWQEKPWPYLSVHVTHALLRAKQKGFKPDENVLTRANAYLRQIEYQIPSWYGEDAKRSIIAYALYVRKMRGDADPARARRLIAEAGGVPKLPIEAIGWIWPTISEDKGSQTENEAIRRHVSNRVTETAGAAHFVSGYADSNWVLLHSDRRADGVLLEAMIGDQPQSTIIPKIVKGLLGHKKAGRWTNTQENAFVLLALDRYFHQYENVTPDFVAKMWLGDQFAGQHAYKGRTTERHHVDIPMKWIAENAKSGSPNFIVEKDGPGRLYYRIGMQYAPTNLKLPPAEQGFVVSRLYEGVDSPADVKRDKDGTWRVKSGAKVRVRLSMVNQSRRYHVALVDPLPAGLEAMNPALAVTGEIPTDPNDAAKKDRYWFWSRTWYEHQNMRDERVEAFASLLWDGVWDYTYVARATTPGIFIVPPAKAEEMYSPETFGRSGGDRMIVE